MHRCRSEPLTCEAQKVVEPEEVGLSLTLVWMCRPEPGALTFAQVPDYMSVI